MQLNLFNILEPVVKTSITTNQTVFEINRRLTEEFIENQTVLMQSIFPASGSSFCKPASIEANALGGGKLANEYLKAAFVSAQTANESLHKARNDYEKLAIAGAAAFGQLASSLMV